MILPLVGAAAVAAVAKLYVLQPSPHFTWDELQGTSTGLRNVAPLKYRLRLLALCLFVLEPLRAAVGAAVEVLSAFRSAAVNAAVGGSETSQHLYGEAADVKVAGWTADALAELLYRSTELPLRQVIVERHTGHLHVSIDWAALTGGHAPKRQFLETADGSDYTAWSPSAAQPDEVV